MKGKIHFAICLFILFALSFIHCAKKEDDDEEESGSSQYIQNEDGKDVLVLNKKTQKLIGLVVESVRMNQIPIAATVWLGGRAWYYVQKDETHFIRVSVPQKGEAITDSQQDVVVTGAQILLSEEFRDQIGVE